MNDLYLTAEPTTAFAASAALCSRAMPVTASPTIRFDASAALCSRAMPVAASPTIRFAARAALCSRAMPVTASPTIKFTASAELSGASDSRGMSLCLVVHELLMLWGIDCMQTAPKFALRRALNDVNAAMQTVWNQAADRSYWNSEALSIPLSDGQSSQVLDNNIQNVTGPCRRADTLRNLSNIGSLSEFETFRDVFLDGDQPDEPVAYHIERYKQTGADPAKCVFHVTPPVSGDTVTFTLDIVREPTRYNLADLDTCPLFSIPHQYVETLLLPIARYRAAGFTMLFTAKDQLELINREYQEARRALRLADPLPGNEGDNMPQKEVGKSK